MMFALLLVAALPSWINAVDGATYIQVPASSEFPHGFWIARTEVTVGQFRKFTLSAKYRTVAERAHAMRTWKAPGFPQTDRNPVVWLAFEDALAYARWAGVDLPTEAEWVYAMRAGATTKFPWGDEHDNRYMWHRENAGDRTHPVASKMPNAWGLYDMVGNAWEYLRVATPDGAYCEGTFSLLGASYTRCPRYRMRNGKPVDAIAHSLGPVQTTCRNGLPPATPWDDDRGFRCIRRSAR
jgi:formylglycine-generating enzyme required for sulfatase activity